MEYWVSHVKMKENHIDQVKAFTNTVEGLKNPNLFNRKQIVKSIDEKNNEWYTCILKEKKSGRNVWQKGAPIHTVEIDGTKYIRTDKNKKNSDNLGKLPSVVEDYNEQKKFKMNVDKNALDI
jgi:hypothetical protein